MHAPGYMPHSLTCTQNNVSIPVHLQPYYRKHFGTKEGMFPNAEAFYKQEVSLPMFPNLTSQEQQFVIDQLTDWLKI